MAPEDPTDEQYQVTFNDGRTSYGFNQEHLQVEQNYNYEVRHRCIRSLPSPTCAPPQGGLRDRLENHHQNTPLAKKRPWRAGVVGPTNAVQLQGAGEEADHSHQPDVHVRQHQRPVLPLRDAGRRRGAYRLRDPPDAGDTKCHVHSLAYDKDLRWPALASR